jgi:hypothetical protein
VLQLVQSAVLVPVLFGDSKFVTTVWTGELEQQKLAPQMTFLQCPGLCPVVLMLLLQIPLLRHQQDFSQVHQKQNCGLDKHRPLNLGVFVSFKYLIAINKSHNVTIHCSMFHEIYKSHAVIFRLLHV